MPPVATTDIIAAVKTRLETVTGIGKVDDRWGGEPAWLTNPQARQAYWVVSLAEQRDEDYATGRNTKRYSTIRVEGWMPLSYSRPNTATTWYTLLEDVTAALRASKTLSLLVLDCAHPLIKEQNEGEFQAARGPAVLCHHAEIHLVVEQVFTYETA